MIKTAIIRFAAERGRTVYHLKLGPLGVDKPPERRFEGGDEVRVQIHPTPGVHDCVDLTFDDGEFAIEVPQEFFAIIEELDES